MAPQNHDATEDTLSALFSDSSLRPAPYPAGIQGPMASTRRVSVGHHARDYMINSVHTQNRRNSHDVGTFPRKFLILDVKDELRKLLKQEATKETSIQTVQITIEDRGPRILTVGTEGSGGTRGSADVRGVYALSNLLQQLILSDRAGLKRVTIDEASLYESPVTRLTQLINNTFWTNLTRRIDGSNIGLVAKDPKDWTSHPRARIYVPTGAPEQYEYYTRIAKKFPEMDLDVQMLKENGHDDDEYVRDLNDAPGLLAIAMERIKDTKDGEPDFRGLPFVVPGDRFNELYGWDSYMISLGLLLSGKANIAESMVRHFCFSIRHYGKILNANRSYYLRRSQPPFLTDMALRVYEHIKHRPGSKEFLREALFASIKDYYHTWTSTPRLDPKTGLSRYRPGGVGVPPETEAGHFATKLTSYAEKHNMSFTDFVAAYNQRLPEVVYPELDEYFLHDRAVRESGHDTSYRLENKAARLATVDLNSLLHKYEIDIAYMISEHFDDSLPIPPEWLEPNHPSTETSASWLQRAERRRKAMDTYMWNEAAGMYYDYDTELEAPTDFESVTTFWTIWARACTRSQAARMVAEALPRFEERGGLVSGTKSSRGDVGLHRPNRQWDYPCGWAPHQILAWTGLMDYGFTKDAQRLAYKWVYMCTKVFVEYNGMVVEKYNVTATDDPHKVVAEYGNQGGNFHGVPTEGFGWTNASYIYGLDLLDASMRRALSVVVPWETYSRSAPFALSVTSADANSALSSTATIDPAADTLEVLDQVRRADKQRPVLSGSGPPVSPLVEVEGLGNGAGGFPFTGAEGPPQS